MHFQTRILPFSDLLSQVRDVIKHHKHENESEAHQVCSLTFAYSRPYPVLQIFRQAPGHQPKGLPQLVNPVCFSLPDINSDFLPPPRTKRPSRV